MILSNGFEEQNGQDVLSAQTVSASPMDNSSMVEKIEELSREIEANKWDLEVRKVEAAEITAANSSKAVKELQDQKEVLEEQLQKLKDIFDSGKDRENIEKQLLETFMQEINSKNPTKEFFIDKGGDLAVSAIAGLGPVLYATLKAFLLNQGILLP